jgi:hypothetical protein
LNFLPLQFPNFVIPATAGIRLLYRVASWAPACAGVTVKDMVEFNCSPVALGFTAETHYHSAMLQNAHTEPFYRPLWRRVAIVAVTGVWAVVEGVYSGDMLWMALSIGLFVYSLWTFIITYPKTP